MYWTKIYSKATIYINELMLVHLILNAKILMWKTPGNVFLGHLGELVFHISQGCTQSLGVPQYLLEFSWILLQY